MKSPSGAVWFALAAAVLFGASTPLAKPLAEQLPATLLAGLLYLGSGIGLVAARLIRDRGWKPSGLPAAGWPSLLGAIAFGGVAGPVLLVAGLAHTSAGTASLLLNLEAVFTALLAWTVFKEHTDRRIVLGMALIVAGSVVLSVSPAGTGPWQGYGPLAVAAACLCWAVDNNLTRRVAAADALFIAAAKGVAAGTVNTVLALALGASLPSLPTGLAAMGLGFLGYGVSLVLFVLALRGLGAARTGAYFSTAPFIGAGVAVLLGEATSPLFWTAAALMAAGVWLHVTEDHAHRHTHEALVHTHGHVHDEHHRHAHDFPWDGAEPHSHEHGHRPLRHIHPHFPDIHHRHRH